MAAHGAGVGEHDLSADAAERQNPEKCTFDRGVAFVQTRAIRMEAIGVGHNKFASLQQSFFDGTKLISEPRLHLVKHARKISRVMYACHGEDRGDLLMRGGEDQTTSGFIAQPEELRSKYRSALMPEFLRLK